MPTLRRFGGFRSISPRSRYLSYDDLATIAYQLAEELFSDWLGPMPSLTILGGQGGAERLRGILNLPRQTAGGKPAYPTIFGKAAALFRSLILNHPFLDGNKRMGAASAIIFLHINGYVVCASDRQLVGIALAVARGKVRDLDKLEQWFRQRSVSTHHLHQIIAEGRLPELVSKLPGRASLAERPLLQSTVARLTATGS